MEYDSAVVRTYIRLLAQRGATPFDSDICRRVESALSLFHEIWPSESKIALTKLSANTAECSEKVVETEIRAEENARRSD